MLLRILKIIGAVTTALLGLALVVAPRSMSGFTGLDPERARGVTELRAAMGGLFTALGVAPLAFRSEAMYRMLGLGYLAIAGVRLVSMFVDGSAGEASNWISLAYEVFFGVVLLLPAPATDRP